MNARVKWREKAQKQLEHLKHINIDVVQAATDVACAIATKGIGEGQAAHGFFFIVGNASRLCSKDENFGEIALKRTFDFRRFIVPSNENKSEKNCINVLDLVGLTQTDNTAWREIASACSEDGGIVIDSQTGDVWCGTYMVNDSQYAGKYGGARTKATSSIATQAGGCFGIKVSEEICGSKNKPSPPDSRLEIFYGTNERIEEPIEIGLNEALKYFLEENILPKHNLPDVPPLFGRKKDLEKLHSKIQTSKIVSVSGRGGTGKSHCAKHFAREWINEKPNLRFGFWLSSETEASLRNDYSSVWDRLGIQDDSADPKKHKLTIQGLAKRIWDHLTSIVDRGLEWIVVFDNVPETDGTTEGLSIFKPWFFPLPLQDWENGRILLTTRSTIYRGRTELGHIDCLAMDVLSQSDAVEMMIADILEEDDKNTTLYQNEIHAAMNLVGEKFFDGLPLAIATANAQMIDEGANIQEYLKEMKQGMSSGEVTTAVTISLEKVLEYAQKDEIMANILEIVAFINPDRIQLQLLGKEKDKTAAIRKLRKLNILRNVNSEEYSIHRMHQQAARKNIPPTTALKVLSRNLLSLFKEKDNSDAIAFSQSLLPHAEAFTDFVPWEHRDNFFSNSIDLINYAKLIERVGIVYYNPLCDYSKALNNFNASLNMLKHIYGPVAKKKNVARVLVYIGNVHKNIGQSKNAITFYQESLDIFRSANSPDAKSKFVAGVLMNIGQAHQNLGLFKEALNFYEKSLDKYRSIYGDDAKNKNMAAVLNKLGDAHSEVGQDKEASDFYRKSLDMHRRIHDADTENINSGKALTKIGNVHNDLGQLKEALDCHQESLDMYRRVYGADAKSRHLANLLNNLGNGHSDLGQSEEARHCYQEGLDIYRSIYGAAAKNKDLATVLNDLGNIHAELGQFKEALDCHQESLDMYRSVYGADAKNKDLADVMYDIGNSYIELGQLKEALEFYEESLDMYRSVYGDDAKNKDLADVMYSIGNSYIELGQFKEALDCHEESLGMYRSVYGDDAKNKELADVMYNIGNSYIELGQFKEALDCHEESLDMYRSVYGDDAKNKDLADVMYNIGNSYNELGQFKEALEFYEESLDMYRSVYGADAKNKHLADVMYDIGNSYIELGQFKEALDCHEESLAMYRSVYGDDAKNKDLADVMYNIGNSYNELGQFEEALDCHEESLAMYRIVYGADTNNSDIAESLFSLGKVQDNLRQSKEAHESYQLSLSMFEDSLENLDDARFKGIMEYLRVRISNKKRGLLDNFFRFVLTKRRKF